MAPKRRFQRLEHFSLLKVFRKPKVELRRFERLEVEGHKIKLKITAVPVEEYLNCPSCHRNNPKDSLYCLYCSYVFETTVQVGDRQIRLEPWEIKCPGCGRVNNRNTKHCLYCGWRIAPYEKTEMSPELESFKEERDLLKQGETITLDIDGKVYRSVDNVIPPDIRELMLQIKREGYSKEKVDAWVKRRNLESGVKREEVWRIDERIAQLRQSVFWRIIGVGIILLFYWFFYFSIRH